MATVVAFAFSGDVLLSGEFVLEPGLNVVYGLNGAGKTRLLRGVRASLLGSASDVGGGVVVRLGGGDRALNPWEADARSVEQALAAELAADGEYMLKGMRHLGGSLTRERSVPDDWVFPLIDRLIAQAAGEDQDLVGDLTQDRYFILMPTGTASSPSWDVWPVADVTLPRAGAAFAGAVERERALWELEEDWGTGEPDDPLTAYSEDMRGKAFFATDATAIHSRSTGLTFRPSITDRFQPYWHGTDVADDVAGISISGRLDFGIDVIDDSVDGPAATRSFFAELAQAEHARRETLRLWADDYESADGSASTDDDELLFSDTAGALSAKVTIALGKVLLDGPGATLTVSDSLQRFSAEPVTWSFSRTRSVLGVKLDMLSRAERAWADRIITDELYWHRREITARASRDDSDTLRPVLTLLDEPEAALHRAAESHMARALLSKAADSRRWILAATHSPELLDAPAANITEVARDFDGLGFSHIHRLSIDSQNSLTELGLRPSDLLQLNRVYLLVEGMHDAVLLTHYFDDRLARARVRVVPISGATQLSSTFDSQVLYDYTSAHVVALLDNLSGETLRAVWEKAQDAARHGQTDRAIRLLLEGIATKDAKGNRIEEAQFIVNWLIKGIESGRASRLTPEGLEKADVIEYLPIGRVLEGYTSWDELRTEHRTDKLRDPKLPNDFKRWLNLRKGIHFDADSLRRYAPSSPPAEFERLVKTVEAISADVASRGREHSPDMR